MICPVCRGDMIREGDNLVCVVCGKEIRSVLTADVVSVRHGKWIEDEFNHKLFFCSECGEPYMSYLVGDSPRWNYCPNCGAKMEVGR